MLVLECTACSREIPADSKLCPYCGAPVESRTALPTEALPSGEFWGQAERATHGRFPPGTKLEDRYRIVGLLGRGGMGEVYRADDLKLGQAVALKFLPEAVERNRRSIARFLTEVRLALRVTHPNVCRVHDIGEVDGRHYISMEYVDGEDLASLLRRIGRFPGDRAIEAARQLCAGLAAAHDQGILHRDLKPANVMIDGRGRVKITDFGLASLAAELPGDEVRAGTPAYMAPEQLAGEGVTQRSDIYALGLLLHEMFTGQPALEGSTPAEIAHRQESTPTSPSSIIEGLDPAVEEVILRCLEKEPRNRPSSALAVAAALPGGDPLAAALAAGETPSPELVAEAGASGGLRPSIAVPCLAAFLIVVGLLVGLSGKRIVVRRVTLETPPEVLEAKAREVIHGAGYEDPPADSVYCFFENGSYMRYLMELEPTPGRWDVLRSGQPSGVHFGYRQSPRLLARQPGNMGDWLEDPPPTFPGMVEVGLDMKGRLLSFSAVPPRRDNPSEVPAGEPDWAPLFSAAGFDRQAFTPVDPVWLPPVYADRRAAWEGVYPDAPDTSIRVEAAAYRDRPVAFQVIEPWTRAVGAAATEQGFGPRAGVVLGTIWSIVVMAGAGLVALRNIRLGRGDRKTALRFALYLGGARLLWMLGAHHLPSSAELELLLGHLAWALFWVGLFYVFYLALEPYARRLWPHMLVSWVRLLGGRFRDPLVGRDLLIAALCGTGFAVIFGVMGWIPEILGIRGYWFEASPWSWESLRGLRQAVAAVAGVHTQSLVETFSAIMLLLVLRLLLRRTWIAVVVSSTLMIVVANPGTSHPAPYLIGFLIVTSLFWFVLFRFGLLAIVLGLIVCDLLQFLPLTFDLTAWYGYVTPLVLVITIGVAVWGFWTALAGRSVFGDEILAGADNPSP